MLSFRTFTISFFFLFPAALSAQMFSVVESDRRVRNEFQTAGFTIQPTTFTFTGTASPNLARYDFDNTVYGARYDFDALRFQLVFGSSVGPSEGSLFNVNIEFLPAFTLAGNRYVRLQGRAGFDTGLFRFRPGESIDELSYSTGSLAAGLQVEIQPIERIHFSAGVNRFLGFMSRNRGLENGNVKTWQIPVALHFHDFLWGRGVSFGYMLIDSKFNGQSDAFDYQLKNRQFFIGINF